VWPIIDLFSRIVTASPREKNKRGEGEEKGKRRGGKGRKRGGEGEERTVNRVSFRYLPTCHLRRGKGGEGGGKKEEGRGTRDSNTGGPVRFGPDGIFVGKKKKKREGGEGGKGEENKEREEGERFPFAPVDGGECQFSVIRRFPVAEEERRGKKGGKKERRREKKGQEGGKGVSRQVCCWVLWISASSMGDLNSGAR